MLSEKQLLSQLRCLTIPKLKSLLGRCRLKFSYSDLAKYLYCLQKATLQGKTFKQVHLEETLIVKYNTFMQNLQVIAPLSTWLFTVLNKLQHITPTSHVTLDSTLVPCKDSKFITSSDYNQHRVTYRDKQPICGYKLFAWQNSEGKFYYIDLKSINFSDANYLKDTLHHAHRVKQTVLIDRGFGSKLVRQRWLPFCQLIYPPRKSEKWGLTNEEKLLYKKRWHIEVGFRELKRFNGEFKLNIQGGITLKIAKAKITMSVIHYNSHKYTFSG